MNTYQNMKLSLTDICQDLLHIHMSIDTQLTCGRTCRNYKLLRITNYIFSIYHHCIHVRG